METPEAAALAFRQIEDCLEALNSHEAAGIVGSLFIETVESVTEEREWVIEDRERVIEERDLGRRETHRSISWRSWVMTYGLPLRKIDYLRKKDSY